MSRSGGGGLSENEDSLPRVTRVLRTAGPMSAFYAALSLPVPGARRQVYEIKAQCPINNLAAYCKKKNTRGKIATISSSPMCTDILNAHRFPLLASI